ncbi:MAG: UDP-N-acetylmuramoyl-L-alanine--D-glutamate ligase [Oscillospiraceae bacterium]|nr:UDP-N-acetylmuramoyl-L-alanine--D-glutamate ligase [Oscillospiraceae bacterium]
MRLNEYIGSITGKSVAVIGIGVSNTPLINMLLDAGVTVTVRDKKERAYFGTLADEIERRGAGLRFGEDYLGELTEDIVFRSPGIRPDIPEFLAAKARGSIVTSEMEIFFDVCPCTIIAVTGSDGKTTTTTIISELLKKAGKTVYVGGNIGHPLLAEAGKMDAGDFAVLELSSFQLMTMKKSPHIAVLTNLAPNHLDIHKDMAEYVAAKENIFAHQSVADTAIFNQDNDITRELSKKALGSVLMFSRSGEVENGAYLKEGAIHMRRNGKDREVLKTSDILLPGAHNIENYMAAIAAVDGLVPDNIIADFAGSFGGVEHRIELCRTKDGVRFYNDSIASSPSRTIAGLRSFGKKVILIAGGYDKHIPYDVLGPEITEHVKYLVLTGATADKIRRAVETAPDYKKGSPDIVAVDDFDDAVKTAARAAREGDVVILSPASASFDHFRNFMERGKRFKDIINSL